jgi:hypothetical protein
MMHWNKNANSLIIVEEPIAEIPQGGVDFGYEDHGGIFRPG